MHIVEKCEKLEFFACDTKSIKKKRPLYTEKKVPSARNPETEILFGARDQNFSVAALVFFRKMQKSKPPLFWGFAKTEGRVRPNGFFDPLVKNRQKSKTPAEFG